MVAMAGLASSAQAATYTVGTTADTPSGETCPEPASGKCSLRQLIEYENGLATPPSPPDVIVVPAGEYELNYGTLTIAQSFVIVGAGARTTTVHMSSDTDFPGRVFDTDTPGESAAAIFGLKIANGTANADTEEIDGDFGGDIRNKGLLLLSEDWITEGTASAGGGVANDGGTLVVERSLVSDNHGSGEAGGILNDGSADCIDNCTPGKNAVLAVEDSTVADNNAAVGGGIASLAEDEVADKNGVTILDSTIAYNETGEACLECEAPGGGGLLAADGKIDVAGSIVAYNSGTVDEEYTPSNCSVSGSATIDSLGYNLENGTECGFKSTGDLQSTQPDFSSSTLQSNGGNTDTFAPDPTSPAVDAIPTSFPFCEGDDQRGIARPQGAGCDMGAVELVPFTIQATEGSQFSGRVTTEGLTGGVYPSPVPTIEWGDGQTSQGTPDEASSSVSGTHTYAKAGIYNGSVTYYNDSGTHKVAFQAHVAAINTGVPVPTPTPAPPTLLAASPPTVLSTTSAAFTTTVNPEGLATEVHFEYGPVLPGAKAAAVTYGSVTPNQPVGSDFTDHTVTATVTGLLPNITYNVRAVATNSAGSAVGANQSLVTPADPPPPPPVLGKAVNVTPVSGIVYIELPPGYALASAASASPFSSFSTGAQAIESLTKGQAFIPLTEARQIPVGSILETTHGVVGITTATTASKRGKLQSGDFGSGIFKLLQKRKQKGLTELDIINNLKANRVCTTLGKQARIASRHLSSKVLGQLRASGHGNFTARGQDSAATVRGTVWGVKNQCDGTLTHVTRGVVTVRDFIRRKTITLFTGQSYLARGPRP
jgi:hypothetical protein